MIPKIIHYCWFGRKRKPKLVRDCIKSWKKYLPEYQIIEWNETNTDLSHPFVKCAYEEQKWAFVSDYIRLKMLYEYGGIYLDTDMMLLKSLNSFLNKGCFFGAEETKLIGSAIIGAIKGNSFIDKCLNYYNSINYNEKIYWNEKINTVIITDIFKEVHFFNEITDKKINYNAITIYPIDVFYPFPCKMKDDINNYKQYIKPNSYAVHLWVGSWKVVNEFQFLRERKYSKGFKIIFQKMSYNNLSIKYFKKIASAVRESLNNNK
jgi:mannosyltransferase OCH1-like enzyme